MKKISETFSSTLYLALGLLIAFTIIPFLALFGMLDQLFVDAPGRRKR